MPRLSNPNLRRRELQGGPGGPSYGNPVQRLSPLALLIVAIVPASAQVPVLEPVTVSATRAPEPAADVPFTVETLDASALSGGPSPTLDDALRSSADFSLFRRNDSLTANPTSQGVSLRGLGPSGASRSLVLLDGVPLNDPFGGWVPWSLVPAASLSRVEIAPGAGAAAWGNQALAGVIELFTAQPAAGSGEADLAAGEFGTWNAYLAQAVAAGPGTLELSAHAFSTEGTALVAPAERGPIDVDAWSRDSGFSVRWRGPIAPGLQAVLTLRTFDEARGNGTPYQRNQSRLWAASVVLSGAAGARFSWTATAYAQDQNFEQTFSSVNAARTAETPASDQFGVPAMAEGLGATGTWADASGAATVLGTDLRQVRGETREDYSYAGGAYQDQRFAGGEELFEGLFLERTQPLAPGLFAEAALRADHWGLDNGHQRASVLSTGAILLDDAYPRRSGNELSPGAGLKWRAAPGLELHVSGQRAFRVPTLNELYRPFRQGSAVTQANPALSAEHADSAEVGADWGPSPWTLSLTGFASRLEDPVDNVTLAQGPGTFPLFGKLPAGGVGQERLNLGRVVVSGVEAAARWDPAPAWSLGLSAIAEDATVRSAPVAPALVGLQLAEVPHLNGSAGVRWRPVHALELQARVRHTGRQFDDDLNTLPLSAATVLDASVRVELSRHVDAFARVDNLTDTQVETAHSALGVFSVAPPLTASVGTRIRW